jgi:hypothetical protein
MSYINFARMTAAANAGQLADHGKPDQFEGA